MAFFVDEIVRGLGQVEESQEKLRLRSQERCNAILAKCNEFQRDFILDPADYKSLRCPRRAGKSWAMCAHAIFTGEALPGSRILVISLTLKSTKENYWDGAPSGLFALNRLFGLNLKFNLTDCVWWHENGSRGRLAGAETKADLEYLRGAAAEADIIILDECKSFAPNIMEELVRDILEPGLMTRNGKLVMGGTPGLMPFGKFYEATCEDSRIKYKDAEGNDHAVPTCVPYRRRTDEYYVRTFEEYRKHQQTLLEDLDDEEATDDPWSLHSWTVKENTAAPKQWARALRNKRRSGWSDDNPAWRREYLGEWVTDASGMVYHGYTGKRDSGEVEWWPEYTRENPCGLPPEDGPWHLIMGLDFGFEDETGLVLCAYSERVQELRHIYDFKSSHLLPDQVAALIERVAREYGFPEAIVGDAGALGGKVYVETLAQRHGIAVEKADKQHKNDFIELLNSDFHAGRVKIIQGSELDRELCGLMWNLSKDSKDRLARTGQLKEDAGLPNHLCDALLYLWRYAYHFFARKEEVKLTPGSPEWQKARERDAERRRAGLTNERKFSADGYPGTETRNTLTRDSLRWHTALRNYRPTN